MVSHITIMKGTKNTVEVLILIVMDNGLVPIIATRAVSQGKS